jgi:hypothetical protein
LKTEDAQDLEPADAIIHRLVVGGGYFRTARDLNEHGIPVFPFGRRWTPTKLLRYLEGFGDAPDATFTPQQLQLPLEEANEA